MADKRFQRVFPPASQMMLRLLSTSVLSKNASAEVTSLLMRFCRQLHGKELTPEEFVQEFFAALQAFTHPNGVDAALTRTGDQVLAQFETIARAICGDDEFCQAVIEFFRQESMSKGKLVYV